MSDELEPIPDVQVRYRLVEETDFSLVYDSWMKSYRRRWFDKGINRSFYHEGHKALITYLATFTKILVACDAQQPMYVLGWACAHVPKSTGQFQLHYAYVKEDYRLHGIASQLLTRLGYRDGSPILTSHWNEIANKIVAHYPQLQYNPYLITLGATHV